MRAVGIIQVEVYTSSEQRLLPIRESHARVITSPLDATMLALETRDEA